jgi:RecA-family ATPase
MTQTTHQREDVNLYRLYQALITDPDIPAIDTYAPFGPWLDIAMGMHEARVKDGIAGVKGYIRAFNNLKQKTDVEKRLIQLLSGEAPTEEIEESHPRLRIGKQGKPVFRTLSMDDIDALPDIEYLVTNLLQKVSVSMIFGESNAGKTFCALHLALCVAYGMDWIGRTVKQGRVLYIYAEGEMGIKPRLQAWRKYYEKPSTSEIAFIPFPVHLLQERDVLADTIAESEQPYALVVIDPYSMCTIGANQNDQMEVTRILEVAHDLKQRYQCHVLIVHHTNKQDGYNGAASFKNHVDTMLKLSQTDEHSPVVLHYEKQRDGRKHADILLARHEVELYLDPTTMEVVTSCVIDASATLPRSQQEDEEERQIMLSILKQHKQLSTSQWKKLSLEAKVPKAKHYAHIEYLKMQKLVAWEDQGKGKSIVFSAVEQDPDQEIEEVNPTPQEEKEDRSV